MDLELEEADYKADRTCVCCEGTYRISDYHSSSAEYFCKPYQYVDGCLTHCLCCWLGIGPEADEVNGSVLRDFGAKLSPGVHLVILPVARVTLDDPIDFGGRATFYPPGFVDLPRLNVIPNRIETTSLAEHCSAVSGVTAEVIAEHTTVAFPARFDWDPFFQTSHKNHLEFVRRLSEAVDRICLDLVRYHQCRIEPVDVLPGRAGQLDNNHMMAGAILYNATRQQGRVLGGAAFTHIVTKGLGLPIESLDSEDFPTGGEVGHIVEHALSLYSGLLEVNNPTAKFVQALSLLEFLADPTAYQKFEKVKKIVGRYVARTPAEYQALLERFRQLSSLEDPVSKKQTGYRTRIVHMGDRLDALIPHPDERRRLFEELDHYIRSIINHMVKHSNLSFNEYLEIRSAMARF